MKSPSNTPYTYLIGWKDRNVWYYGVRFAKGCHPDDLWTSYFTSSKYVKGFRKKYGEPDVIEIRKVFGDTESAQLWETKVLQRMSVISDNRFLNKAIGKSLQDYENRKTVMTNKYGVENVSQLPGVSKKISESLKGKEKTKDHKQSMKEAHNRVSTKELHSKNMRQMRALQSAEKRSEIGFLGGSGNKGKNKSTAHASKIADSLRNTYLINDLLVIHNAKEYCKNNNLNYISFTQAAKRGRLYRGLKIEVIADGG